MVWSVTINMQVRGFNLFQTEGQIDTRLSTRGPQANESGQVTETIWPFTAVATLLL
jgi:hypothetical protein